MGGLGSGDWFRSSHRATVESKPCLDANAFHRHVKAFAQDDTPHGWLGVGRDRGITYTLPERATLQIQNCFRLGNQAQTLKLDWTACHYGRERPWFLCPVAACGKRVGKLYWKGGWQCRKCLGLVYGSQRQKPRDRYEAQADKLRQRLRPPADKADWYLPPKPKGMHMKTYAQLAGRIEDYEELSEHEWCRFIARLFRLAGRT